ncbi:MAG: HDIG domain-containing protein [Armatimonadetes bacterium]|nr:HDIG domain-containing protein [Armatimonadota bacterium]
MNETLSFLAGLSLSGLGYWFFRSKLALSQKEHDLRLSEQLQAAERALRGELHEAEAKLESRREKIDTREEAVAVLQSSVLTELRNLEHLQQEALHTLEKVAKLSAEEAINQMVEKHSAEAARRATVAEKISLGDSQARSRSILISVMERSHLAIVNEVTVANVVLPNEEMKGRIIGRDGRNIRAFEQITGVDIIIDETPESVGIASFDPVRREMARLALINLMLDGRIHPGRIEESFEQAKTEIGRVIEESGENATVRADVFGLPHQVVSALGNLRFRTSYSQNVLDHSVEVSLLAASLASELGCKMELAGMAGLLHDIGKGPQ